MHWCIHDDGAPARVIDGYCRRPAHVSTADLANDFTIEVAAKNLS
jgi:hypothetical protein